MDVKKFEQKICRKSYTDVKIAMEPLSDLELLELLDSKSIKVGDTAVMLLLRRDQVEPVINRVLEGKVTTKTGRVRATNLVKRCGKACVRAAEVFLYLLGDRTEAVVSTALFGLAFLQEKQHLVAIKDAMATKKQGTDIYEHFRRAIEALEKQDPFIYSPHFRDAGDVWKLDKERFADRIG